MLRALRIALCIVLSLVFYPLSLQAQSIRYVKASAPAGGNGQSWPTAYADLQDALAEAALPGSTIGEIWVAAGSYRPDGGTRDQFKTFKLVGGLSLYGGFAGTELTRDQRNPSANQSILNGDLGNLARSAYLVTVPKSTAPISIDGLRISNGDSGIYGENAAGPTIRNCWFVGNSAAVQLQYGNATIQSCDFDSGSQSSNHRVTINGGTALITGCVFHDGSMVGIKLLSGRFAISGCVFRNIRSTSVDGPAINDGGSSTTVTNCLFDGNSGRYGGAINTQGRGLRLTNCTFVGNTCPGFGGRGGAIYLMANALQIRNCIFWQNSDYYGSSPNSQIYWGYAAPVPVGMDHSIFQGGWPGNGNLDADPLFVNRNGLDGLPGTADDDLRLAAGSPAIDAGDNTALVDTGVTLDLAGMPRFQDDPAAPNTGVGPNPIVDMGAYESGRNIGFIVNAEPVQVPEGGVSGFSVALLADPQGPLTVTVSRLSGDPDLYLLSSSTLHFDSNNYMAPQMVVLAAAEDADAVNGTATFLIQATGLPSRAVQVTELDNDQPALTVLRVRADAPSGGDGHDWPHAFNDLQAALAFASLHVPAELWVAAGSYRPAPAAGNRSLSFTVPDGIALYGGFAGAELTRQQRAPALNVTILSGDLNGDDTLDLANMGENSYSTAQISGAARINGFTFTGANSGSGFGTITVTAGSPFIQDCRFVRNRGYGVYAKASPQIIDSFFLCASGSATGIHLAQNNTASVVNCVFTGTGTNLRNDGLYVRVANCTFSNMSISSAGLLDIVNSILWKSSSSAETDFQGVAALINYSCLKGWTGALGGMGNIGSDPQFIDADGADNVAGTEDDVLALLPGSPCADAGDNSALLADSTDIDENGNTSETLPLDIQGEARRRDDPLAPDSGAGPAPLVDMGAYEGPAQYLQLSPSSLTMNEGMTATFSVTLAQPPPSPLAVTMFPASGSAAIHVLTGSSLFFDASNYGTPHWVTLSAAEDPNFTNDSALVYATAPGIFSQSVQVSEVDNDPVPSIVYVNASATGLGTGLSWPDAYTALDPALSAAAARSGVQEIWVATGTYTRPITRFFQLVEGVALLGGFTGFETQNTQRNPAAHPTILIRNSNNAGIVVAGSLASCTLDGFTIRDGAALNGGGLNARYTSLLVRNCSFIANTATGSSAFQKAIGGGAYLLNSTVVFENCSFLGNHVFTGASPVGSPSAAGGALYALSSNVTFINCLFSGNAAQQGAATPFVEANSGAIENENSTVSLINCTFANNSAVSNAGAVRTNGSGTGSASTTIVNCVFWGNSDSTGMTESSQIGSVGTTSVSVNYSLVQGLTGGLGGMGNISGNPLFVNPAGVDLIIGTSDDNLRVGVGSPCIDAGNNSWPAGDITTDLDGVLRRIDDPSTPDTGLGLAPMVDLGAYEYAPPDTTPPALVSIVSRKIHATAGSLDLQLYTSGGAPVVESRAGAITQLILRFSEVVVAADGTLDSSEIQLTGATLVSAALLGNEITVGLSDMADGSCVGVILEEAIQDLAGNPLSLTAIPVGALLGDVDSDGDVTLADSLRIKSFVSSGQGASAHPECDLNLNGTLNLADALFARSRIMSLPKLGCLP